MLVDVTDNEAKASEALEKADKNLLKDGAKKSHKTISGHRGHDLRPAAKGRPPGRPPRGVLLKEVCWSCADGTMRSADVLARLGGKRDDSLATVSPYQAVSKRLATAAGDLATDVRWYIDPLGVAEYRPDNEKRQRTSKCCATRVSARYRAWADTSTCRRRIRDPAPHGRVRSQAL